MNESNFFNLLFQIDRLNGELSTLALNGQRESTEYVRSHALFTKLQSEEYRILEVENRKHEEAREKERVYSVN